MNLSEIFEKSKRIKDIQENDYTKELIDAPTI